MEETLNSIVFKLNQLVDKVVNLEYKLDLLTKHVKRKQPAKTTAEDDDDANKQVKEEGAVADNKQFANNGTETTGQNNCQIDQNTLDWMSVDYGPALDSIFKVMNVDTLKMIRLVCQSWNYKCVPILSSKTWIDLHTWENKDDASVETIPIHEIYQMMDSGTVGGLVLFKNLSFTSASMQVRELEVQLIIREFGENFQSLSLEIPKISLLKQILENWCKKLEELSIYCTESVGLEDDVEFTEGSTEGSTFKLKSLKVIRKRRYEDFSGYTQSLIQISKCSPQLTAITLGEATICSDFFIGISSFPDITNRITDLNLSDGEGILNFDGLSLPNLLKFNIQKKSKWITPLLTKVAKTLVSLTLGFPNGMYFEDDDSSATTNNTEGVEGEDDDDGDHNIFFNESSPSSDNSVVFLDRVRVFKLKGFLPTESSIRSLECNTKMPNLQVLYINVNEGDLDSVLLKSNLCNPVETLRKLTLIGSIACVLSCQILVTLFPNITKFKMGLARKFQSDYTMSDFLKDGLPKFISWGGLKTFALYFNCSFCDNLGDVIAKLKDLPGLTEFEIGNFDKYREIVCGLLSGIKQVPQITWIKFVNIVLNLSEAKRVLDELKSRNIRLEVVEEIPYREEI